MFADPSRKASNMNSDVIPVLFFRICTFFFQWYRKSPEQDQTISNLVFSMDVLSFTMLFNTMDRFQGRKLFTELEPAAGLHKEMTLTLLRMRASN